MLTVLTYLIVVGLVVLCAQVLKKPGYAAALVWAMISLKAVLQQGNAFLLQNTTLFSVAVAAVAFIAATNAILTGKLKHVSIPQQVYWYAALNVLCVLSISWSGSPQISTDQFFKQLPYVLTFGFLAPLCIHSQKQLALATEALLYFGALVVLGIVVSEIGRRSVILVVEGGVTYEANPLAIASFAGYVGIVAVFSMFRTKLLSFSTLYKALVLGVCLTAMVRSGSRGQVLAFAFVMLVWLPLALQITVKRSAIVGGIISITVIGLIAFLVQYFELIPRWDINRLFNDQQTRFDMTSSILNFYSKSGMFHWLFGLGSSSSYYYIGIYPHNIYAETLAEEGLIGFFLLTAILLSSLRAGYQLLRAEALPRETRLQVGSLIAILSFNIVLGFKQGSLLGSSSSVFSLALATCWLSSGAVADYRVRSQVMDKQR